MPRKSARKAGPSRSASATDVAAKAVSGRQGALRQRLVETALDLPELSRALDEVAEQIRSRATARVTEATVAGYFERGIYGVLRDVGLTFDPDKEQRIDGVRHTARGRLDSRLGATVIEYKRPARLETAQQVAEAVHQGSEYLVALTRGSTAGAYGFVTDGRTCIELRAAGGVVTSQSPQMPLNGRALLRLTKSVHALSLNALTPANLIRDFCEGGQQATLRQVASTFFKALGQSSAPKTRMLRSEWEQLFRLGHDDRSQQKRIEERRAALGTLFGTRLTSTADEYRALFALHSAYALVVKLMAYRVVSELRLSRQVTRWSDQLTAESETLRGFCADLEDGALFRRLGIVNLLEGDFFAWYSDRRQWDQEIFEAVRSVLMVLGRYEQTAELFAASGAVDLFRELYEATVPAPVRSSFGEFYTPHWLAAHVLESARPEGMWRALDPCSGSGTFLITAIERLRLENPLAPQNELLEKITQRVVGIDLNPLAVLTSRVNYFIHIADLVSDLGRPLVIPVFLGDASYTPARVQVDGVECVKYRLTTLQQPIEVTLPLSLVSDIGQFFSLMLEFERAVLNVDEDGAAELVISALPREERKEAVVALVRSLADQLVTLERNGWNGIWARIVSNFLATAAIGSFSVVFGNPPWIDWKNLPQGYREKIKGLCVDRGLFSGDGRTGGINLNVCALITHVATANWLAANGRLAFLMPKELSVQQSYEGWRTLQGDPPRRFDRFVDWSSAGHPFDPVKEDFMTFVIESGPPRDVVQVTRLVKPARSPGRAREWRSLEEAVQALQHETWSAGQIVPGRTAFTFAASREELDRFRLIAGHCSYKGREGIEFYPQELQIFTFDSVGPKKGSVYLQNIQVQKSKFRIPRQITLFESRYLYPLIRGRTIEPFEVRYDGLLVPFPYAPTNMRQPRTIRDLTQESPQLLAYYRQHEEMLRSQTQFSDSIRGPDAGEFYGLARTGPYTMAPVHVCFRDNTKWGAAVVSSVATPWGEDKTFLFQNHAVSMCERDSGGFINEREAHYVCAILNTPIVGRFIIASSDERSFKIRPPIWVPEFDPTDGRHTRLAQLSRLAHRKPEKASELVAEMEQLYLDMCRGRVEVAEPGVRATGRRPSRTAKKGAKRAAVKGAAGRGRRQR